MAAAKVCPDLYVHQDYKSWLHDVKSDLSTMDMEIGDWQDNWKYDFRREYNAGVAAHDAAIHAHDFWWQHVLDESWT